MKNILLLSTVLLFSISIFGQSSKLNIYTQKSCSRCQKTKLFLNSNKIKFSEFPLEIERNGEKMDLLLSSQNLPSGFQLTLPVVEWNGKLYYNIKNLDSFLNTLQKSNK